MHTYPFAACGWRSIAFEPQPSCVEYLRYTCQTNGFSEVDVVPGVLDEQQAASVPFFVSESSWFSSLSREQVEKFEPAETSQTRAWTIDDYCEENDDLAPTCLKIDVEGAELRVLRGAHHTLDRARPDIFAEVLTTEENKAEVWEMLPAFNRVFLITTDRGSPLRPILDLPAFLTAGEGHDHIDVVAFAGPTLARRLDDHFDLS